MTADANRRTIEVPGIGPVLFRRNRRARRVVVSVSQLKGVRASVPVRMSFDRAAAAVLSYADWINRHRATAERDEAQRQALGERFAAIGEAAATRSLIARLQELGEKHGFTCNKVSVRRQTTRWGSCSAGNNISLNVRLVCLPDELRDYVIFHELVHTRVHNHGPEFHAELEQLVPDHRLLSKRLRKIGLQLL